MADAAVEEVVEGELALLEVEAEPLWQDLIDLVPVAV
jgi:hypothetical protein